METQVTQPLVFSYKNWRGEVEERTIRPIHVWFGESGFHRGEQWFLRGFDVDKKAMRDFALNDMRGANVPLFPPQKPIDFSENWIL
jgi:predicted DNA-binding transcriptional regulator YafY